MAYNINNYGSIADALSSYRDDIFDTMLNIGNVFDNYSSLLLSTEDSNITVDTNAFPMNLVYNEENITIARVGNDYHLFDGNQVDKGVLVDKANNVVNSIVGYDAYDILNYINGSYTSNEVLLEACDLALVNDDPDTDIAAMLSAKYGPQSSSLTGPAKDSIDQVMSYLQHSDRGPTGVAGFISELYSSINDTNVDSSGVYYQSSDKNWHIQGFVGAYAIGATVRTASMVIQAVVTVVKPLIGLAIGLLCGALSKIKDWFLSFTSSKVKVNPRVTNNMLNMSMFDYDISQLDAPAIVDTYFSQNSNAKSVSYRMSGCTWVFAKKESGGYHLQIMANIEFQYNSTHAIGFVTNGTYTTLDYVGGYQKYFYDYVRAYDNYTDVNNTFDANIDRYDAQARVSIMTAYHWIFGLLAARVYGMNYQGSYNGSMPENGNTFDNAAWTNQHLGSGDTTWSQIVNYRNMLRSATTVGTRLCQLFEDLMTYGSIPVDTYPIARHLSFPWVSTFYMEVPNYTSGAVWGTILATAAVATVAITIAVMANKIKKRIRKFMVRKQLDVEGKRYAYENADEAHKDQAFEEYWQSIKSFNKWTILTRYNKIDYLTGYMSSDTESAESSGYGINLIKQVKNGTTGQYETIDLAKLYKLIAG